MVEVALKSDICVIPSDQTDIRKNGVGTNRLITALALGLPVAASILNSYSDFSKYFIDINSPKLHSLITNPQLFHENVSLAQQTVVEQFRMDSIEKRWAEFIEEIY